MWQDEVRALMEASPLGKKLNLGCGYDIREGYVNADAYSDAPGVTRMDMTEIPWPFPNESFEFIRARHVLEHVPFKFAKSRRGFEADILPIIFEEMWRVLKPRGRVHISVPLGSSRMQQSHWQHYRAFIPETFAFFNQEHPEALPYEFNFRTVGTGKEVWRAKGDQFLRVRGLGLTTHLAKRVPLLRPFLADFVELNVVLEKILMERHLPKIVAKPDNLV